MRIPVERLRPTAPAVECLTVGHAVLVRPKGTDERGGRRSRSWAEGLALDPDHRLVVVDVPAALPLTAWRPVASRLSRDDDVGRGLRLVPVPGSAADLMPAGQWLADRLGTEVLVPSGELVRVDDGSLFVRGDAESGWLRLRPDAAPHWDSRRAPKPLWEDWMVNQSWTPGPLGVCEPLPGGAWLRPASDALWHRAHRLRLTSVVPCDRKRLCVVLGHPGGAALPLTDVARFWRAVPEEHRGEVRFVGYGPVAASGEETLGQALSDLLGRPVTVYCGLPVAGPAVTGEPDVHTVCPDGAPGWRPFARELGYLPRQQSGGQVLPPRPVSHRLPVHGLPELSPGVYGFAPDAVLEVTQSGLWMRPPTEPADAQAVRALPLDPTAAKILYDTSSQQSAERMQLLALGALWRLDPATRQSSQVLPAAMATAGMGASGGQDAPAASAPAGLAPAGSVPAAGLASAGLAPAGLAPGWSIPAGGAALTEPVPEVGRSSAPEAATAQSSVAADSTAPERATGPEFVTEPATAPEFVTALEPTVAPEPTMATLEAAPATVPAEPVAAPVPDPAPVSPAESVPAESVSAASPPATPPSAEQPSGATVVPPAELPAPPPVVRLEADLLPAPSEVEAAPAVPASAAPAAVPAFAGDAPRPPGGAEPVPDLPEARASGDPSGDPSGEPSAEEVPKRAARTASDDGAAPVGAPAGPGQATVSEPSDDDPRVQPTPRPEACAVPPSGGIDRERDWLRGALRQQYDAAASSLARLLSQSPGLRGDARKPSEDTLTDLVAVRLYLSAEGSKIDAAVRAATVGPHVPLSRCVYEGLRRLPSHRGAGVLRTTVSDAQWQWYRQQRLVTEWGFCSAVTGAPHELPGSVDFLIWSLTARRTGLLEPAVADRVVFLPGTSFKVLDVRQEERREVLLRELSPSEIAPDGTVDLASGRLDEAAVAGLERAAENWRGANPPEASPEHWSNSFGSPPGLIGSTAHGATQGDSQGTTQGNNPGTTQGNSQVKGSPS
ncbi:hypothetical protein [Streptomyces sp. NPDC001657]|uniref:hypothetical protein n=1 Tax=Streptomyces sp. NPDC001657 TaxID=3154522 RepID=UPI00332A1A4C